MNKNSDKLLLRALAGETLDKPPVWFMRQAGRYLAEYKATRAQAGDFLSLCYTPELAAEVTLQPIRRFGFDASILFADILLVPQALGMDLWFAEGEGPRLALPDNVTGFGDLRPVDEIDETLSPIYETVGILSRELPDETTLIGFAGAPWTVATYMIAGKGTADQGPAKKFMLTNPDEFDALIKTLEAATVEYLSKQIEAGAEVIQLFDSWAGSLPGNYFMKYSFDPLVRITKALKVRHPDIPVIAFPRGAGPNFLPFAKAAVFDGLGLDTAVPVQWAAEEIQSSICVQGNLDPLILETGGAGLKSEVRRICDGFAQGPHIFNLGHGITQFTNPGHVETVLNEIRL